MNGTLQHNGMIERDEDYPAPTVRYVPCSEPLREVVGRMRALTESEQDEILRRFVARQKNAALLREMELQREARVDLLLQQLRHDFTEAGRI